MFSNPGRFVIKTFRKTSNLWIIISLPNALALNIAEVYDPETDRWVYIAPMLAGRYWFGTGVINGEIYAVGGVSYDGVKLNA